MYPAEYSWSQEKLETICIESFEDGRCFERGPNNFELGWGRILACKPPKLFIFSWQIDVNRVPVPDAAKVGEVQVQFEPEGNSTCLASWVVQI